MTPRAEMALQRIKEGMDDLRPDCWSEGSKTHFEAVCESVRLLEESLQGMGGDRNPEENGA